MENTIKNLLESASKILAGCGQEKESGNHFNCVEICGVGTIEPRHTEIIAALLDPSGNHGFGAKSLKAFFRACDLTEFAGNCDDCYVQTEVRIPGRRPDIVISGKNLCVVIENKTNTCDHYMQLADYRDWLKTFPAAKKALLYLTYHGENAKDEHIKSGEYQCISYAGTLINWLLECAAFADNSAADFCRQYAEFIQKTIIQEEFMNNEMTETILKNVESLRAAACINRSFDRARFQKLAALVRECWQGDEEIYVDNRGVNIDFAELPYKIGFQYNNAPYYGILRKQKASAVTDFKLDGFESATPHWIAYKYVNNRDFKCNWSDADFLAGQWEKDNFASFKKFISECLTEVKNTILANAEEIDKYSSGM